MANASRKSMGPGATHGKGDASGAGSVRTQDVPDNAVLSNRDKAQGGAQRGQDGKWIAGEQRFDTAANQRSRG